MKNKNIYVCTKCNNTFNCPRGLSIHSTRYCKYGNGDKIDCKSSEKDINPDIVSSPNKKSKLIHSMYTSKPLVLEKSTEYSNVDLSIDQSFAKTFHEDDGDFESKILLHQSQEHAQELKNTVTTLHSLAEVDLLKILSDLNCHNIAYDRILSWASFWNSRKITFQNTPSHIYHNRDIVLKKLSKKHDMEKMQPNLSKIDVHGTEYHVTTFDFQQQVLSLLRDEDLMQPNNLVLESDCSIKSGSPCEKISEINHSDWYLSTYLHYNKIYGKDNNRFICGVIFAIDKTHTDTKGKLCLESVNFTLSIFNTETRRNNHRAWRSLGFINDLNTKFSVESTRSKKTNMMGNVSVYPMSLETIFVCH